jgi:iron-siderophore transport system substrate-binding protein
MQRPVWLPLLVGALLLTGCGAADDADGNGGPKLAKPVTVEHKFGKTTIDTVPKRIVTIDVQWTDVMLAMGVEPVGYSVDPYMPDSGVPWQKMPAGAQALPLDDGLPVEQILALDPDLVVASWSVADKDSYDLLSARVPTIAGPADTKSVTPWRDLVRTAGQLLNQPDKANQVVAGVEKKVTETAKALPQLKDRTFALGQYLVGDAMTIVADEEDGSSLLFRDLGMTLYPPLVAEGAKTNSARVSVSTERADLLRADLLLFLVNGGDESDLADIPGFDQLPGTVAVLDYPTIVGLNTPTPLSIPYALDKLRPYLDDTAAAAG